MAGSSEVLDGIRAYIAHSPFAQKLGVEVAALEPDHCELLLPFDESLATYGDVLHGGAMSTLADTAATAAALASDEPPAGGATVDLTVHFLQPATGEAIRATADVVRRGRSLCSVEVDVHGETTGTLVVKALVTYKVARAGPQG